MPVSASLMHDTIMNEYILDAATVSGTDWIVTFPTKRYYVAPGATGPGAPPFQHNFNGTSCDTVALTWWDREENSPSAPPGGFSPPPPGNPKNSLCYEANVVTFTNTQRVRLAGQRQRPDDVPERLDGCSTSWMRRMPRRPPWFLRTTS